jgi:putative transposase
VAREYGISASNISRWKARELEVSPGSSPASEAKPAAEVSPPAVGIPQEAALPSTLPAATTSPAETPATGRYTKAFKDEVIRQVASGRRVVEVARQYALPETTVHRWKKATQAARAQAAPAGAAEVAEEPQMSVTGGASPIDEEHRRLVLELKEKHPNMGPAQLQNQLKRFYAIRLSRQHIARIFREAGIPLQKPSQAGLDSDPSAHRFEMSRPNELWAIDFKEYWIHSEKAFGLFLIDDFSRFCVGFAQTQNPTVELAVETVNASIQRYGRPERILSDRGPQFHAWNGVSRFDAFLADFLVDHTITKADHPFTNGKIEAFNRSLENDLLDVVEFDSLAEAERRIREHLHHYNFLRTHMGIAGLVPADRYFGMVEEAQRALVAGLERAGAPMRWLRELVSHDAKPSRRPTVLEIVVSGDQLELLVLGRRFRIG